MGLRLENADYVNCLKPLMVKCNKCGFGFKENLARLKAYAHPCPVCREAVKSETAAKLRTPFPTVCKAFRAAGLKLLATKYRNNLEPLLYRCLTCGYTGRKSFNEASDKGSGCRRCGWRKAAKSQRLKPVEMRAIAREAGAVLLEIPRRSDHKTRVRFVNCGHVQLKSLTGLRTGSRCSICSGKARRSVEDYEAVAKRFGGLLIRMGKNSNSRSEWKCKLGHNFSRSFTSISMLGTFCNVCSSGFSEMLCKAALEAMFGKPFLKVRLPGSKSVRGKALEIDLFNRGWG